MLGSSTQMLTRQNHPQQVNGNVKDMIILLSYFTLVGWFITNAHHKAKTLQEYYLNAMWLVFVVLCEANTRHVWQFCHDNPPAFSLPLVQTFLAKHNILLACLVCHSPDVAVAMFGCSPSWKCWWKGPDLSYEKTVGGVQQPSCASLPKITSWNDFNNRKGADRCLQTQGEFFEAN